MELVDIHKAHIKVLGLQRNVANLALEHRRHMDMLQEAENMLRNGISHIEKETGKRYNEETQDLEEIKGLEEVKKVVENVS